jgi:hypothetical protein
MINAGKISNTLESVYILYSLNHTEQFLRHGINQQGSIERSVFY